jgi:uncharacterized spore protein YtfJ
MTNLVEKIAQSVTSLGVKTSYGEPVTLDGVQIIPVALVWFGFGGGGDGNDNGGGGGGGVSIPIGAYVGGPDGPQFKPNIIAMMAISVPLTIATGRTLVRLVKAASR